MELRSVKCPNCGASSVEQKDGLFRCDYCKTTFTIDYDAEDAAMDKNRADILLQREQFEHEDKIRKEERRSALIRIAIGVFAPILIIVGSIILFNAFDGNSESLSVTSSSKPAPQPVMALSDFKDTDLEGFEKTALLAAEKEVESSVAYNKDDFSGTEPEYVASYFFTNSDKNKNALLYIYKITWTRTYPDRDDEVEDTYVAFYFEGIKMESDGTVIVKGKATSNNSLYYVGNRPASGEATFDDCYDMFAKSYTDYSYEEIVK